MKELIKTLSEESTSTYNRKKVNLTYNPIRSPHQFRTNNKFLYDTNPKEPILKTQLQKSNKVKT